MAESAVQSAAETLTYFLRQKDFYLSHVDVSVMSLRNKLKALLKDVDGMRGYNESVQLIEVANNTKNVIDSFICNIAQQRGETSAGLMSYQSTFNSGIKDKPAIEDLGKKISDLKTRLDEIILSNRSQYGIHNIQPCGEGEASTSSNQIQIQREKRAPNLKRRLDEIILPNRSQYGIHNIQASGEASTSSNQSQIQREERAPNLKTRLDEIILSNRSQYGIHNIQASGEASTSSTQSQIQREKRALIVEEAEVFSFEDETRTLVGRLIGGDMRRVVVSITGMGGTGKSTLAKKVHDNDLVRKSFDFRCWVNVPQEYLVRDILLACIITFFPLISRGSMKRMSKEDLRRKLSGYLERKRYLVVIDGIWSREAWDGLVTAFPDWENGSRVLLTTRNEEVARYADTHSTPHKLRFLNENESWTLFCKKALLGNPSPACFPNLEELGRKMVAKCGGLPLAITVLGGVLSRKEKSVYEWEKVLKSLEWHLNESEDAISGILALSYDDLPCYLKFCFLYSGAFPENSELYVDKLIRMWIAEGFVHRRGGEEMEDVAEDCIEELISRSMFQVDERKSNGMAKKCRIHNLLRDLAISKANDEISLGVYGNKARPPTIMAGRLVFISGDIIKYASLDSYIRHHLRLLSLLDFRYERDLSKNLASKIRRGSFKFLRVMHLQSEELSLLPDKIGDLIHLRYVRLEMPRLVCLPSTVTSLANLQTLDIQHSFQIVRLPNDIVKMEQIRHLMVRNSSFSKAKRLHHLSNLQTLAIVKAGSWIKDGLEKLTNLRDLGISRVRGDVHMALSRSISKLVHLRSLRLSAHSKSCIPAFESFSKHKHLYEMILEGRLEKLPEPHVFPPNLTELCLRWSKLERDPMVTLEKLPNLRSLHIFEAYVGKEMVCSAGGFPLLVTLGIVGLNVLEWRVEEGAMLILRSLEIGSCGRLKMLPDGLRYIITLQELKLVDMSEELKERVREEGADWLKIRHIPSLIIK